MKYKLKGSVFHIKEELKDLGCYWDLDTRTWRTPDLSKEEFLFKRISELVKSQDAEMIPCQLSPECAKIQEILSRGR